MKHLARNGKLILRAVWGISRDMNENQHNEKITVRSRIETESVEVVWIRTTVEYVDDFQRVERRTFFVVLKSVRLCGPLVMYSKSKCRGTLMSLRSPSVSVSMVESAVSKRNLTFSVQDLLNKKRLKSREKLGTSTEIWEVTPFQTKR